MLSQRHLTVTPTPSHDDEADFGAALTQPDLFEGLTEAQLEKVMAVARVRRLKRNEYLFSQGEPTEGPYIVQSGTIRTQYTSPGGREITFAYWNEGNLVGAPLILGDGTHMWSGVAATDCEVLCFRGRDLRLLAELMPTFAMSLIEVLEFKCIRLSALVQTLGTRSVPDRLAVTLYNLAALHGRREPDGIVLSQLFTHEVLANMVGCSRQWVTNVLQELKQLGVVRIEKRKIIVVRPERLLGRML